MKKSFFIFFVLIILLILYSFKEAFSQEKASYLRNPFLTQKEEMKELGIKPTEKKTKENIPLQKLNLSAIVYGEKKVAIINSEFYIEGDIVGNFTIKEIKPLSIILKTDLKEMELKLKHVLAVQKPEVVKEESGVTETITASEELQATEEWTEGMIEQLLGVTE
ncbi:MAG: hypothetical protein P9M06_05865 [Candidatus Saelkia tenebricola]|nr:hypothetical protein [Candidatus Saelkia tenebricola]